MPNSRLWSAFWTVAGCLFLLSALQFLVNQVFTLFGLVESAAPTAGVWLLRLSHAIVPIWAALAFVDWRWGWKADNAGLRNTPAARFWALPGLAGGIAAAGLCYLLMGTGRLPQLNLQPIPLLTLAMGLVGAFATELIFRGVVISRFEQDLNGREMLLLALGMPLIWALASPLLQQYFGLPGSLSPAIGGLGSAALSLLLSLIFLQTHSVWLVAGIRIGLLLGGGLLGLASSETTLLLVAGVPAAVLLFIELSGMRRIRRPGPRGGAKRVIYGKTVKGPWGPH